MASNVIKIKKGLNIKLDGEADKIISESPKSSVYAIKPTDFVGVIPKMIVKAGDEVKAGDPIFFSKTNERIKFCSPVSGEIAEIVRGAKRKILEIRILPDANINYKDFGQSSMESLSPDEIKNRLLESGTWPFIRQRPFGVIANPDDTPKSIHVSCFDTNPLGPDVNFMVHGNEELFNFGIDVLNKLTNGKVHLNLNAEPGADQSFGNAKNVQKNYFKGPHPAGNVGVQIHHVEPINKGDVVWYCYPSEVITIGALFSKGIYDASRIIAVTGSQIKTPKYVRTISGVQVSSLLEGNLKEGDNRIISGNVLTGNKIDSNGFLGYYHSQLTVIPEGNNYKFLLTDGWLSPGLSKKKFSMSKAYPSWLFAKRTYDLDTNLNGEERAFVVTGQLEKVFPFDIYPMHLIKSIMVNDIDLMEQLGIYEVDAEDFALCEVVCTSKINIQEIVREGLEDLRAEMA